MLTFENILFFLIFAVLLFNIQTIVSAIILYFQEMKEPIVSMLQRDEINHDIKEIIKPYEATLLELGFEYQSQVSTTPMFEKYSSLQHSFYYFHPIQGVHAFIDTTPMRGCLRAATISYVTFYESQNMILSYDCFAHNMMATSDHIYIFDHYSASFEIAYSKHLIDREIENEKALRTVLNQEGLYNYSTYMINEMIENAIKENILHTVPNGYKFSASLKFLNYIKNSIKGYKKAKTVLKTTQVKTEESPKEQTLLYSSEQKALEQQLDIKPKESSLKSKIKMFIISGVAFVLLFGLLGIPWTVLPMIVTVLIVHELGHFYAMKFFGYKDTSIFFIPLFGAAAKGDKEETTPFEEYIVFLAGPLPGIIISIIIGIVMLLNPELRANEFLKEYAIMSLVLNYINLLPIFPLDGGKIVQTLLFTRYPKAQFYFFLLSLLVIIFSALMLKSVLLGIFAATLFLSINHQSRTSKLIAKVMKLNGEESLKEKVIKTLTTETPYKEESLATKSAMAKQALKILNAQKPSTLLMILGLGFYLVLILAPLIIKIILSI